MSMRWNANPTASAEQVRLGPQGSVAVSARCRVWVDEASVVIIHVRCFGDQSRYFGKALHPATRHGSCSAPDVQRVA